MKVFLQKLYWRFFAPFVHRRFFTDLIWKSNNFGSVRWLGHPIWQNIFDIWITQETIAEVKPELLIECGTNRGGSSLFFAHLFDLMGKGEVITIDIEKLHNLSHPRITYLLGSSTAPENIAIVRQRVAACRGPVMVILDSDHSEGHVRKELEYYAPLVTPGSYCLVQDTATDTLRCFRRGRPGPLPALLKFLQSTADFEVDEERSTRFLISHHPMGWLKRRAPGKSTGK